MYSEKFHGETIYIKWLLEFFKLERFSKGAGVPTLNRNLVHKENIIDTPKELQIKFVQIVEKIEAIKLYYQTHLQELENLYGSVSQKAFKGELELGKVPITLEVSSTIHSHTSTEPTLTGSDTKTKSLKLSKKEIKEILNKRPKRKRDITNMSLADYYGIPEDLQSRWENLEFNFINDDLFYQFLLKDSFNNQNFTSDDIYIKLHSYFYHNGNMDYDHQAWKEIIFKFLDAKPPLLEQFFDEEDNTIKLKLTNEAYKA